MKFATLLAAVTVGSIAAPAMAQDRDPAEDFNGPYIAIGGGASLQSNDSGETLLFDTDGDGNYGDIVRDANGADRSEEHTSELQSLMRISYAVFCLKKNKHKTHSRDT